MPKPLDPADTQAALDAWADLIAALGPEAAERVANAAGFLAFDVRVPKVERAFAKAQGSAVSRAIRRAKAKRKI